MTANTGRPDFDAAFRISTITPEEPLFILRGRDPLAAQATRAWASLAHNAGVDPAIIEQALKQADRLEAWSPKALPDGDRLSEAEKKQLRYELGRRAWRDWQGLTAEPSLDALLMNYQRGFDAGRAAARQETLAAAQTSDDAAGGAPKVA